MRGAGSGAARGYAAGRRDARARSGPRGGDVPALGGGVRAPRRDGRDRVHHQERRERREPRGTGRRRGASRVRKDLPRVHRRAAGGGRPARRGGGAPPLEPGEVRHGARGGSQGAHLPPGRGVVRDDHRPLRAGWRDGRGAAPAVADAVGQGVPLHRHLQHAAPRVPRARERGRGAGRVPRA